MINFFKPTTRKIVLSLIIFLLLPVWTVPIWGGAEQCGSSVCTYAHWLPFGGLYFIGAITSDGNQAFAITSNYIWKGGALIIVSYAISCLISYLIDKRKQS